MTDKRTDEQLKREILAFTAQQEREAFNDSMAIANAAMTLLRDRCGDLGLTELPATVMLQALCEATVAELTQDLYQHCHRIASLPGVMNDGEQLYADALRQMDELRKGLVLGKTT